MHKIIPYIALTAVIFLFSFVILYTDQDDQLCNRDGYSLSYNEKHEQANWVFYKLDSTDIQCEIKAKRKNKFKADKNIITKSATLSDYAKSGFDRGHLKSSADESCSQEQMDATFLMSNMSPQEPRFNRGVWKSLEMHVRSLVKDYDSLYVYTGGVLEDSLKTIGSNQVSVPNHYFKIVYMFRNDTISTESYLMPNSDIKYKYMNYKASIATIEQASGLVFPKIALDRKFPTK
jgi:endonuclease G